LTAAFIGYFADGEDIRPEQYALNGGAPWYETYECADGKWLAVGAIEPYFFRDLCGALQLEHLVDLEFDSGSYEAIRTAFVRVFQTKTRDEWLADFAPLGLAVSPVLELTEVPEDAHIRSRGMVNSRQSAQFGEVREIGVAPKLSRTPGKPRGSPPQPGRDTRSILTALGRSPDAVEALFAGGIAFSVDSEASRSKTNG
jgi:alpha-methylacyl-CoA racemase